MAFIRGTRGADLLSGTDTSDFILGLAGDDMVFAGGGDDVVTGDTIAAGSTSEPYVIGADTLWGGAGNDLLIGGFGADRLEGEGGGDILLDSFIGIDLRDPEVRDILNSNPASLTLIELAIVIGLIAVLPPLEVQIGPVLDADTLNGGDGDDLLVSAFGSDVMDGGDGDDTFLIARFATAIVLGGPGDDVMKASLFGLASMAQDPIEGLGLTAIGGSGSDLLIGGNLDDLLFGNEDDDVLVGRRGDDQIVGSFGDDRLEGGADDDILVDCEAEVALGAPGPRRTLTITADLAAFGTPDTDTLIGGAGKDVLVSLCGDDRVEGGDGADVIILGPFSRGIATIEGGLPNIHIGVISRNVGAGGIGLGGAGQDQFVADFGSVVSGDDGDDTLLITASGATPVRQTSVSGGAGGDSIRVEMPGPGPVSTSAPPEVAVLGGAGDDIVEIVGPRDAPDRQTIVVAGGGGDDVVNAAGYDIATAAIGVAITGGRGRDALTGTGGKDSLNGGPGADTLTGGTGKDVFEYDTPDDGPDLITDFEAGTDQFHIDGGNFGGGLAAGPLALSRFVAGFNPAPPGAQGVFLYNTGNESLAWDADGTGGSTAVAIAILANQAPLTAADFMIV
jgi:Ca2+-binding RTX toxin-like protein